MDTLSFDHPKLLQMLWALPVLAALYVRAFAKKRQALERFATANLLSTLAPFRSAARQQVKAALTLTGVGMLVVAMAGPRWGTGGEDVPLVGIDVIFVLDVSKSMLARDVVPDRLGRAKLDIKEMLEVMRGDRVGLVTFAGTATLTCPLTVNYGAFGLILEGVDSRSTPRGGTNIGDAVRHALDSFSDKTAESKAVVVISDGGETEESYAVEASRRAFEEGGIRIFTVGLGDMTEGTRIPPAEDAQGGYVTHQGQEVWTKLEPAMLESMAAATDGAYFSNPDFRAVYERIRSKVSPREFGSARGGGQPARFHWFAGMALLLLTIETLISERKAVTR